jgi:hypothetical protein
LLTNFGELIIHQREHLCGLHLGTSWAGWTANAAFAAGTVFPWLAS